MQIPEVGEFDLLFLLGAPWRFLLFCDAWCAACAAEFAALLLLYLNLRKINLDQFKNSFLSWKTSKILARLIISYYYIIGCRPAIYPGGPKVIPDDLDGFSCGFSLFLISTGCNSSGHSGGW